MWGMVMPDAGVTVRTGYEGRHTIKVERKAVSYVRVSITADRGGEGKYVDLSATDATTVGFQILKTALRAFVARS